MIYTSVSPIPSISVFKPHVLAVFFRCEGSMKDEVFNLTLGQSEELVKQLLIAIETAKKWQK